MKNLFKTHDIIVDCIFGIGLNKEVRKNYKKIIKLINQSKKVKVSIDMPSGINGNTGEINSIAVKSNITLVMGFFKPAHFLLPAKILCGEIILLNLGLSIPKKCIPEIRLITPSYFKKNLPKYDLNVHKYTKGHTMVIGGKMPGASRLVALSSRKIGCGLSTISVEKRSMKFYSGIEPGTILKEFNLQNLNEKIDVLVIGPGLGKNFSRQKILQMIKFFSGPIIIDADAISVFQKGKKEFYNVLKSKNNIILTPHEGEFKRVFNLMSVDKVSRCLEASRMISNVVILKGNDSVIAFPDGKVWINNNARISLATAGSGDILCGIIAGFLAQKMKFEYAVVASVWIHGALSHINQSVIVEDFVRTIPSVLASLKNNN